MRRPVVGQNIDDYAVHHCSQRIYERVNGGIQPNLQKQNQPKKNIFIEYVERQADIHFQSTYMSSNEWMNVTMLYIYIYI